MSAAFLRKYATATTVYIPLIKRGVVDFAVSADWTPAAGDVRVSIDGGTSANIAALPTAITMQNTAQWAFTLSVGETTGKKISITVADAATKAVEDQMFVIETYGNAAAEYAADFSLANLPANIVQIDGVANSTHTAGMFPADLRNIVGAAVNATLAQLGVNVVNFGGTGGTFAAGRPEVNMSHVAGAVVSTTTAQIGTNTVSTSANAITATSLATDALTAAKFAADVATEFRALASGTSDSGTTTTMVDAARTEADTDYWAGQMLVFTSGNLLGQARYITGFNPATDTITFTPATTQGVSTQTYEIWPGVEFLRPTTTGRTLDVSAGGEAGIDWANIGSPATAQNLSATNIDVDQVVASVSGSVASVTGAVASVTGNVGGSLLGTIGGLAAQAKTDVNTEMLDVLTVDTYPEPGQGAPGVNISLKDKIGYLYKAFRNKLTQTSTTLSIYADDTTTVDHKATVSDDGTTYTRQEVASGP